MMYYNPPIPGQDDQIVKALDKLGLLGGSFDCTKATNMPTLQVAVATARNFLNQARTPPPNSMIPIPAHSAPPAA